MQRGLIHCKHLLVLYFSGMFPEHAEYVSMAQVKQFVQVLLFVQQPMEHLHNYMHLWNGC